jgi:hypothetical protein
MRAAPPVQATSRVGGAWPLVQRTLLGTAAASLVHWLAGWLDVPAVAALFAAAGSGALAWVWAATRRLPPPQRLRWDGSQWSLASLGPGHLAGEANGKALPIIDLGSWMLVRFDVCEARDDRKSRPHWLALSRTQEPAVWRALRVALYATAPGAAMTDAADPAA